MNKTFQVQEHDNLLSVLDKVISLKLVAKKIAALVDRLDEQFVRRKCAVVLVWGRSSLLYDVKACKE